MTDEEKWDGAERRAWVEAFLSESNPKALFFDDLDAALIGYVTQGPGIGYPIYDADLIIDALMRDNDWDNDMATEWFLFNTEGSYVGDQTPYILHRIAGKP